MVNRMMKSSVFLRVLTSLVGLPILGLILYMGGWLLKFALLGLACAALHEFYKALSGKHKIIHYLGYVFTALYYLLLDYQAKTDANVFTVIIMSFTLSVCVVMVIFHTTVNIRDAAVTYFGFCYAPVLLSTIYLTNARYGYLLVAIAFLSAWGCDTGAYLVGRTLGKSGKHKLTPKLSPKKTVEGAVGGTVTSALLTSLIGVIALTSGGAGDFTGSVLMFTLLGAVCAIFAQLGDLFASAVKRHTGIKDFGNILPGHGGIIDRFDSVFFTAPILYVMALLILK